MAASLLKLRAHCSRLSRTANFRHSISDQTASPPLYDAPWLRRPARFSRFKHNSPKPRGKESSSPAAASSFRQFRLVSWYLLTIKSNPIATKSATTAVIYTAADLTSQAIVGKIEEYEFVRTLRMAGYGMLVVGPSLHYWYNFLSRKFPKRDLSSTLKKMALGQLAYGPAMTVVFFSVNAALQGENVAEIVARLRRDLVPTMMNGLMYWPLCDFLTFKFIPVHLQPLVVNSFSYLWTVYMTYMASLEKATTAT